MPKVNGLSLKQKTFVEEYLVDLNASQAAIRAGYSKHTAKEQGCQLLTRLNIQEAINSVVEARSKRTEITQDRVLEELARLAFLDPRKMYDEDGNLIPFHLLPIEVAAAVGGIDVSSYGENLKTTTKIKLIDKKGSLDLLGRHLKMFTDKIHHTGDINITNRIVLIKAEWHGNKRDTDT